MSHGDYICGLSPANWLNKSPSTLQPILQLRCCASGRAKGMPERRIPFCNYIWCADDSARSRSRTLVAAKSVKGSQKQRQQCRIAVAAIWILVAIRLLLPRVIQI
eukprot:2910341-Amphidinium_carterae.3